MMNTLVLVVLRILHVVGGAFWIGVVVFFRFFLQPAIEAIGPESQKFDQALNKNNRFSQFMGAITLLNVLSGFILFYLTSGGLKWAWITSGPGIGFSIGALAGIGAFFIGGFSMRKTSSQLRAASEQLAAQGDSPAPDLAHRTASLQKTLHTFETLDFWLLAAAMLTMATSRYWNF
jgi:uncharacterized membrane protein